MMLVAKSRCGVLFGTAEVPCVAPAACCWSCGEFCAADGPVAGSAAEFVAFVLGGLEESVSVCRLMIVVFKRGWADLIGLFSGSLSGDLSEVFNADSCTDLIGLFSQDCISWVLIAMLLLLLLFVDVSKGCGADLIGLF